MNRSLRRDPWTLAGLAALVLAGVLAPPTGAHQPHDPMYAVEASPVFPEDGTVLASTLQTSQVPGSIFLMRSVDGGEVWSPVHEGLPNRGVTALAYSPDFSEDGTILAGTCGAGLYRSRDRGSSWEALAFAKADPPCILGLLPGEAGRQARSLYMWTRDRGLYRSADGGVGWIPLEQPGGPRIRALLSLEGGALLLGSDEGLFLGSDGGARWRRAGAPVGGLEIRRLASGGPGGLLVAAGREAVWGSRDSGDTWESLIAVREEELVRHEHGRGGAIGAASARGNEGVPRGPVTDLAVLGGSGEGETVVVATAFELWQGSDGGRAWSRSTLGLRRQDSAGRVHYRSLRAVPDGTGAALLFVAGWEGLHRSRDEGRSWRHLELLRPYSTRGVAFSPAYGRDGTLFAATYGSGLLVSRDRGEHWRAENRDLVNTALDALVVSPAYPERGAVHVGNVRGLWRMDRQGVWAEARPGLSADDTCSIEPYAGRRDMRYYLRAIELAPAADGEATLLVGGEAGCIDRSVDGGRSWLLAHDAGKRVMVIRSFPGPEGGRLALAGLTRGGLLRSADGGASWSQLSGFPAELTVSDIEPWPGSAETLLASTFERGVLISRDHGRTWSPVPGTIAAPVLALATAKPGEDGVLLLAATNGRGVLISRDGGASWEAGAEGLQVVLDLAVSPDFPSDLTLLAGTPLGPYLSTDAGASWRPVLDQARYEEQSAEIFWGGGWTRGRRPGASGAGLMETRTEGAELEFSFQGCLVRWIGNRGPAYSRAGVWIDGAPEGEVDLHAPEPEVSVELFRSRDLPLGPHTLRIQALSTGEAGRRSVRVAVDAFDVGLRPAGAAPTRARDEGASP